MFAKDATLRPDRLEREIATSSGRTRERETVRLDLPFCGENIFGDKSFEGLLARLIIALADNGSRQMVPESVHANTFESVAVIFLIKLGNWS